MKLILASRSPRRNQLLAMAGLSFETAPAACDEEALASRIQEDHPGLARQDLVQLLARAKAYAVLDAHPQDLILAADTLVSLDDRIFGKPLDREEARWMLRTLAGRTHEVDTGVALVAKDHEELFVSQSLVTFRPLTRNLEDLIDRYVETGLPLDKAGAYGIQELGGLLIERIDGDFFSVMGLPVAEVYDRLRKFPIQS
ncbi:MAG: Maf family protein [Saccharofermentanales bacterium]